MFSCMTNMQLASSVAMFGVYLPTDPVRAVVLLHLCRPVARCLPLPLLLQDRLLPVYQGKSIVMTVMGGREG